MVGRIWLDQGFGLELHPSREPAVETALLRLFGKFRLRTSERELLLVAHEHATLVPTFVALHRHVVRASMTSDTGFELLLEGGLTFSAGPDDGRNYWELEQPFPPVFESSEPG